MALSGRKKDGISGYLADIPPIVQKDGKLDEQQINNLNEALKLLIARFNGGVTFGNAESESWSGHIDGQWKVYYFALANTAYELPHGLGRIPIGMITVDVDQNGAVIHGETRGDWSDQRMFVSCNVAGTTALFVVI